MKDSSLSPRHHSYRYRIYGLVVQSSHRLEGLPMIDDCAGIDVDIVFAGEWAAWQPTLQTARSSPKRQDDVTLQILRRDADTHLQYVTAVGGIDFCINQAATLVRVTWTAHGHLDAARSLLCHPILGYIARLRGATCLHASVIAVEGHAIALLGAVGAGKSTLTASLMQMGCQLVAEDVAVLLARDGGFGVQPGLKRPRLDMSTLRSVYGADAPIAPIFTNPGARFDKVYPLLGAGDPPVVDPVPLTAIYLLGQRSAHHKVPKLHSLPAGQGALTLMANTFAAPVVTKSGRIRDFETLGQVAQQVPIRSVQRPDDLAMLPATCAVILTDLSTLIPHNTKTECYVRD